MKDYINIACSPLAESCVQVDSNKDYMPAMRKECLAFKHQLERKFPGVTFEIKEFPHDFGPYLEVVACFDDENREETQAALEVEYHTPKFWDAEAKKELGL